VVTEESYSPGVRLPVIAAIAASLLSNSAIRSPQELYAVNPRGPAQRKKPTQWFVRAGQGADEVGRYDAHDTHSHGGIADDDATVAGTGIRGF
jgi:hypothetical protein